LLTIFFAGLIGSVLQTLIIAAILIPKVLLISVAYMMAPFAYLPIFLIFEVSLIVLLSFPFAGFSLDWETFCSALVPAFYRISSNDFNSNLESNFKAKIIRFLQLGGNVGYSVLLTVVVAVLVSFFLLILIHILKHPIVDVYVLFQNLNPLYTNIKYYALVI
jgi:hypothetical protein